MKNWFLSFQLVLTSICFEILYFTGIWQSWTATRGDYLNSGVQKYNQANTSDLRDCMSFCLEDEDTSYNCSSIVKSVSGDQCDIVNKRSDDTGVTPEVNAHYQYFNLPLWYSGESIC